MATQQETDERYMEMAIHEAELAYEQDEVPVGCVIVANGRINFIIKNTSG